MDNILYQTFKIIWSLLSKKYETVTDNSPIKIYVNKIVNSITFKFNPEHYLKLLTPETMKLLRNTKNKIIKDKIGENVPHLETTEVVLVHCNMLTMIINKI